jgi:hypothetical protein
VSVAGYFIALMLGAWGAWVIGEAITDGRAAEEKAERDQLQALQSFRTRPERKVLLLERDAGEPWPAPRGH